MMKNKISPLFIGATIAVALLFGCSVSTPVIRKENNTLPSSYSTPKDSQNAAHINWRNFFTDSYLISLIDTALVHNQELQIMMQEIEISRNEIKARKGEYLPFINFSGGAGIEKTGRYTRFGALEDQLEIKPGSRFPDPLQNYGLGLTASWEIDIWKKLRNAKKATTLRYLATAEGKNFMMTQLIAEIADAYYDLMALDNLIHIIEQNIQIQSDALKVVKQQKESAKVSQLAVNRFEAQLLNTQNLQYAVKQKIIETENRIRFLCGSYAQPINRNSSKYLDNPVDSVAAGLPFQLLMNRPDIRQSEYQLAAAKLDVSIARARFYPSLGIKAGMGFEAFNTAYLLKPESMLYNLAGDLMAPLINRNAIKAAYKNANAQQIQAIYRYEQTLLNAYVDVLNQIAKLNNYTESFKTKKSEADLLVQATGIANSLFNSARADYAEVLLTQREALNSKMDLVEIRMNQYNARVNIYRALGGGWK